MTCQSRCKVSLTSVFAESTAYHAVLAATAATGASCTAAFGLGRVLSLNSAVHLEVTAPTHGALSDFRASFAALVGYSVCRCQESWHSAGRQVKVPMTRIRICRLGEELEEALSLRVLGMWQEFGS